MGIDAVAAPRLVGIGGSTNSASVSSAALRVALDVAAEQGASTRLFDTDVLRALPVYSAAGGQPPASALELIAAVRDADGLIISSPGYHGAMSGLVKNAIDHLEALRDDPRPYLQGRAVGIIVVAAGWQACGTALVSVRSTVHALRGWPTPYGVTINSAEPGAVHDGLLSERVSAALATLSAEVLDFAHWQQSARAGTGQAR